ncbi:PLP-dependent transferase, partial [Hortaea werneckii]
MSANNLPDMSTEAYDGYIESMRKEQYPMLHETLYLDHAGTTPYSKRLMDRFHAEMMGNLFGNPHSASPSSQRSTQMVEDTRLQLLSFCGADPDVFDVVFTANSTSAIKIVVEAFREQDAGFCYGYHADSHTSLVGVREAATMHHCFESDSEVESWIGCQDAATYEAPRLFAYPAQSNMTGRRLPLDWCSRLRQENFRRRTYTLLDAAAYASTSPLDLSNTDAAPDFTVLSLYKIFGFPDLGALIVRKECAPLFRKRRYFGGGTVDMVVCLKEQWHAPKSGALHEQLEDGTLPIHSIIALKDAMETQLELFGTMERVSRHTAYLARRMRQGLAELKHGKGKRIASIYGSPTLEHDDANTLGPIIAFNLQDSRSSWVSNTEVEKLASVRGIHLRTGGVCNPGGIAHALGLSPWEMRENFSALHRCGSENDIMN